MIICSISFKFGYYYLIYKYSLNTEKYKLRINKLQNTALNILKTGSNVFITGSAGTGKTYLLNKFTFYLKSRKVIPTIVAPTGIAASHLQGQTIHSFFSLGIRDTIDDYYIDSLLEKKYLQVRFSKLKVLIIDEISMVSPEIFSSVDRILRAFKKNDNPLNLLILSLGY